MKIYLEKHLKPLLFAHIGGIVDDQELARGAIATLTRRLQTDRNTVASSWPATRNASRARTN